MLFLFLLLNFLHFQASLSIGHFFSITFFIEVQLIYNIVLKISSIQQSDLVIHLYVLFQILFHYRLKIWSIVPSAIQQVLVVNLFYIQQKNHFKKIWKEIQKVFRSTIKNVAPVMSLGRQVGLITKLCPILATPWTAAHQDTLSMRFSRQEIGRAHV